MREILFRGKRCDNGEWVQGYYIRAEHHWHKHGIHKDWITLGASANGGWFALHNKYAVKAETVGQFTGLTDKTGKKIFEGDIHECIVGEESSLFVVKHGKYYDSEASDKKYGWYFENTKTNDCYSFYGDEKDYTNIIGNIHDNPELLGGSSNE